MATDSNDVNSDNKMDVGDLGQPRDILRPSRCQREKHLGTRKYKGIKKPQMLSQILCFGFVIFSHH
jgi:hypothetical protein